MVPRKVLLLTVMVLAVIIGAGIAYAASSGSFAFDYAGDAGDNADGPQFDITLSGLTNDGAGCDAYVMMMFDSSGTVVDVDPGCISGPADDDGDYGSVFAAVSRPITYALFDLDGAEYAAMNAISQSDPAHKAYVLANGTCLDEKIEDASSSLTGLPALAPYVVCGASLGSNDICTLALPSGSVIGEAPNGAELFYEPGKSTSLTLNPGTYWVIGVDESGGYYKIMLACQFLWVRVNTMQPSNQAPQNGAPLPTRVVS